MIAQHIIDAVKHHARENYEHDGWDYVVETMNDADIAEAIEHPLDMPPDFHRDSVTEVMAIQIVGSLCKLLDDRRKDIEGTRF